MGVSYEKTYDWQQYATGIVSDKLEDMLDGCEPMKKRGLQGAIDEEVSRILNGS